MNSRRVLELDAVRGIAALAVVCYHYFYRYDQVYGHEGLVTAWSSVGHYGVQLFFMVSGYVIYMSLSSTERAQQFALSRFKRLYPTYWLSLFLSYTFISFFGLEFREVSIYHALLNSIMLHEYFNIPSVDGVYWTLTLELTFYLWIGILFFSKFKKHIETVFLTFTLLSILYSLIPAELPFSVRRLLLLDFIPYFLAGICFYKLNSGNQNRVTIPIIALCLFSTIVLFSINAFLVSSFFYGFFYLVISGRLRFLAFRPLIFLGSISYPLYLIHQNIGYIIIKESTQVGLPAVVAIFFAFTVVILLSIFINYIIKIVFQRD